MKRTYIITIVETSSGAKSTHEIVSESPLKEIIATLCGGTHTLVDVFHADGLSIKDLLALLPPGYSEKAISQHDENWLIANSFTSALLSFRSYLDTDEGENFWWGVYDHYKMGRPLPPLEDKEVNIDEYTKDLIPVTYDQWCATVTSLNDKESVAKEVLYTEYTSKNTMLVRKADTHEIFSFTVYNEQGGDYYGNPKFFTNEENKT